ISFVTRNLGPEKWGTLTLFMSIIQLLFSLGINWTSSAVVRFGKEEFFREGHLRKTFGARSLIVFGIFILLSIFIFLLRKPVANYVGLSEYTFLLIIPMLFIYSLQEFFVWILKALGLMKQFALTLVLRPFVLITFVSLFIFLPISLSVQKVINFEIISYFAVVISCLFFIKSNYFLPFEKDINQVRRILVYSWPSIFTFLFGYTSNWMDVFFIKYFMSNYYVGIYQAAYRMMYYISTPLISIFTLVFPLLMAIKIKGRNDLIEMYIKKLIPQLSFVWNIIVSILIAGSGFIIKLIFGESFTGASLPFMVLLLGVSFQVLSMMYTSIFSIFDWLKYVTFITFIISLVNFTVDLMLLPKIGILGAAIATALSYAISSILYLTLANKLASIRAYKALFFPTLSVLSFLFCLATDAIYLRVLFICFLTVAFALIAKFSKIFSMADLAMLEKIEMPPFLSRSIRKVYRILS
ncbi:MAG: oligosaccharide flippase family protein, partial [Candidatus Omnitrophota bacterium]|nr:oligosaccharide flippase family protein [Candidatus Omnitrophota bacterium]